MRENEIEYPNQISSNSYVPERQITMGMKFDGACSCGDSIQTIVVAVPDHGNWVRAYIGWCMDCQKVCASLVTDEVVLRPAYRTQIENIK